MFDAKLKLNMEENTQLDQQTMMNGTQSNGMATASLILGICSIVLFWVWFIGIIAGILAIVFAVVAKNKIKQNKALGGAGAAKAGLITGIIGIAIWLMFFIIVMVFLASVASNAGEIQNMFEQLEQYQ